MNEKDVVLEARGVEKSYRDDATAVPVLRGVNLAVHRGETVAILGTSGSGKSTLLHALGGLDTVDAGEVTVAGESMTGLSSNVRGRLRNAHLGSCTSFIIFFPNSRRSTTWRCRFGFAASRRRRRGSAPESFSPPSAFRTARITCLRSSRAANGSASPSPARS